MAKCVAGDRSRNADRTLTSGRRWTRYRYSHHLSPPIKAIVAPVTSGFGSLGTRANPWYRCSCSTVQPVAQNILSGGETKATLTDDPLEPWKRAWLLKSRVLREILEIVGGVRSVEMDLW